MGFTWYARPILVNAIITGLINANFLGGPRTLLETPRVIRRNNSAKDLAAFAESANAMKRLVLRHQAYSTDFSCKPGYRLSAHREGDDCASSEHINNYNLPATPTSGSDSGSISPSNSMGNPSAERCMMQTSPFADSKIAQ